MVLLILLLLTLCFIWASGRWGIDSRDTIDSIEWQRRANYEGHYL